MRDLADDIHRGLFAAFTALADVTAGEVLTSGDVTAVLTGLPVAFFNPVWAPYPSPGLEDDLHDLVATGQQRGIPMRVAVPEGSDHEARVEAVSTARGLEPLDARGPGMALDDLTTLPAPPADVVVEQVTTAAGMGDVTALTMAAFEMPAPSPSRSPAPNWRCAQTCTGWCCGRVTTPSPPPWPSSRGTSRGSSTSGFRLRTAAGATGRPRRGRRSVWAGTTAPGSRCSRPPRWAPRSTTHGVRDGPADPLVRDPGNWR